LPIYANGFRYLRFPIYLNSREEKDEMCRNGDSLGISPLYPGTINNIPELQGNMSSKVFANAQRIVDTLVTLPTHILLSDRDKVSISDYVSNYRQYNQGFDTVQ
jgi:hypothetical protein